ncbi:MAG TPA: cyclic nucleotide-binding domain-containing protein, partial [Kofleriaceae bacterium]
ALTAALSLAAVGAYAGGALLTVIGPAMGAVAALSFVRPCQMVVVPGLVVSPRELTRANLLMGYCESASALIGPLMASALIAIGGTRLALLLLAMLASLCTISAWPLVRLDAGIQSPAVASRPSRIGALADGLRGLAERRGAKQLLLVLTAQYVLIGSLDLICVVLADDAFGFGPAGPGLLSAMFGAGALIGAACSTLLVARRRLAPVLLVSLVVAGVGRSILDVTGRMLLQRSAPQHALASIFATLEALALLGCVLGSVVAQVGIAVDGVRTALVAIAAVLGASVVWSARRLTEVDQIADAPVFEIRLLRRLALFAPLPGPALEGVARATRPQRVTAGEAVVREGEVGDDYYAVVDGTLEVTMRGRHRREMGRGEGFGEIALLADVPRTATVVALTEGSLLVIDRGAFLTAVTGHDASRQAAWGVARAWHPELDALPEVLDPPGEPSTDSTR